MHMNINQSQNLVIPFVAMFIGKTHIKLHIVVNEI